MQDRELLGDVLAGRDAVHDRGILRLATEQALEHPRDSLGAAPRSGAARIVAQRPRRPGRGMMTTTRLARGYRLRHRSFDRSRPVHRGTTLSRMPDQPRVIVVMPAYNAAKTLERTYADIPADLVHHVILVDDVSRDETVEVARQIGPRGHRPRPEHGLRREPEDVL